MSGNSPGVEVCQGTVWYNYPACIHKEGLSNQFYLSVYLFVCQSVAVDTNVGVTLATNIVPNKCNRINSVVHVCVYHVDLYHDI